MQSPGRKYCSTLLDLASKRILSKYSLWNVQCAEFLLKIAATFSPSYSGIGTGPYIMIIHQKGNKKKECFSGQRDTTKERDFGKFYEDGKGRHTGRVSFDENTSVRSA